MRRIINSPWRFHNLRLFSMPFIKYAEEPKFRVYLTSQKTSPVQTHAGNQTDSSHPKWTLNPYPLTLI